MTTKETYSVSRSEWAIAEILINNQCAMMSALATLLQAANQDDMATALRELRDKNREVVESAR